MTHPQFLRNLSLFHAIFYWRSSSKEVKNSEEIKGHIVLGRSVAEERRIGWTGSWKGQWSRESRSAACQALMWPNPSPSRAWNRLVARAACSVSHGLLRGRVCWLREQWYHINFRLDVAPKFMCFRTFSSGLNARHRGDLETACASPNLSILA